MEEPKLSDEKAKPQTMDGEDTLPEDWYTRSVKYLTSENYQTFVLDTAKDVFVMW